MSNDNCVICPGCGHEFQAVPVATQIRIAELTQQLQEADQRLEDHARSIAMLAQRNHEDAGKR
jgi:uncharacterized protein (UPF0212 family)